MKVYIRKNNQKQIISQNCYTAYDGFRQMGMEIKLYENIQEIKDNQPQDIIVGSIMDVFLTLKKFQIKIPYITYPEEIQSFLGRKIWKSSLYKIANNPEKWGIFIKPAIHAKRFSGIVVKEVKDFIGCNIILGDMEVWCSELVNFKSEWRCFVRYGEILDVKKQKGDWKKFYNPSVIEEAVRQYKKAPKGYGIDFGVTEGGETLLVEVNDGYSLGAYGLDSIAYAKLLSARWAELTHTRDECNF